MKQCTVEKMCKSGVGKGHTLCICLCQVWRRRLQFTVSGGDQGLPVGRGAEGCVGWEGAQSRSEGMRILCVLTVMVVIQCVNLSKHREMYTQNGCMFNSL